MRLYFKLIRKGFTLKSCQRKPTSRILEGFTLIELLLALSLSAILIPSLIGLSRAGLDVDASLKSRAQYEKKIIPVLQIMRNDLRSSLNDAEKPFEASSSKLSFHGFQESVDLMSPPTDKMILYTIENGHLNRTVKTSGSEEFSGTSANILLEKIAGSFEFAVRNPRTKNIAWVKDWDPSWGSPKLIRIHLEAKWGKPTTNTFEHIIEIPQGDWTWQDTVQFSF